MAAEDLLAGHTCQIAFVFVAAVVSRLLTEKTRRDADPDPPILVVPDSPGRAVGIQSPVVLHPFTPSITNAGLDELGKKWG